MIVFSRFEIATTFICVSFPINVSALLIQINFNKIFLNKIYQTIYAYCDKS